ncbi:MAG TPA: dihydroneopterin aldolase family protein [Thermoplasmata archaeon]|nr:dihydroneopterin aldolase family protein [Thermoplasmata archaeon]
MGSRRRSIHPAALTSREALLFEAGIKLGGIFHQYLGIPVSSTTAAALARSIEAAVSLQPFVEKVRVRIVPTRGGAVGPGRFGYRYVTAEMIDARVTLVDGSTRVVARLSYRADLRYPLMRVESANTSPRGRRAGGA